jgi:Xaa-Pro aminopeptidase
VWWAKQFKKTVEVADPIQLLKACKNKTEIAGVTNAHIRDGAALTQFLCWLDSNWKGETEISVTEKLRTFRAAQPLFRDLSFATIAGMGANGAIVHYHATPNTNKKLTNGLFLLDSGGQYLDGTTDVTRTIALDTPTAEQKADFTSVLKGHIALGSAVFPKGTAGIELDALARMPLWKAGKDYDHGTGHGVGCYLSVHEGPQGISRRNNIPLQPGMILSNEPGFYKAGEYGIRIENLVLVKEKDKTFLCFETLTLAPIDRRLIDKKMLEVDEINWLNAYHAHVLKTLTPLVDNTTKKWLKTMCKPL